MLFKEFAIFLQDIESVSSRLEITEKLAKLFHLLSVSEIGQVPYLLQGRISPPYGGLEFGVAEKSVIKAAASALSRDPKDFAQTVSKIGDLGTAIEQERSMFQSFDQEDLSISQVFDVFVQIAGQSGQGSQESKSSLIGMLITKLDPLSCRYVARIPLGRLRLGASDVTVMDALSWMISGDKSLRTTIERAYQVRPDLSFICQTVKEKGVDALAVVTPVLGTPILMMRAERLSSGAEIVEKLGKCSIEPKYDGLRLQVHVKKSQKSKVKNPKVSILNPQLPSVHIFTRGLEDATHMYPDIVVAVLEELDCDEAIIEGEALGYDHVRDSFLSFQETIQRKRKHDVAETALKIPLRLMAFDVLYVDGTSYIQKPLHERNQKLRSLLRSASSTSDDGHIQTIVMAPETVTDDPVAIEALFDTYITDGLEGIMAKKLDDPYKPGAREYSWVKLKKSYSEKVTDTIDGVVMGYDRGKGKRAAFGIGAVLLGIYDPEEEKYLTIAKIGTGMTDDEWRRLLAVSDQLRVANKPPEYEVLKIIEPDVWVRPGTVLEIRCDELTESKIHSSGWSMRFPRLERFRTDKKPTDATAVSELKALAHK
ncbi:MAG: ATP-dependent DNA ligase [Candidatus Roizmanbacteria bacterium]